MECMYDMYAMYLSNMMYSMCVTHIYYIYMYVCHTYIIYIYMYVCMYIYIYILQYSHIVNTNPTNGVFVPGQASLRNRSTRPRRVEVYPLFELKVSTCFSF